MTARPVGLPGEFLRLRTSGWIVSLCLHAGALFLAGLFAAKIGLAPSTSPFHWDVTVVGPDNPALLPPAAQATPTRSPQTAPSVRRHRPVTATQVASFAAPAPTTSASTATTHRQTTDTIPSPYQKPQPVLEPASAVPLPERQESPSEQSYSRDSPSLATDRPASSLSSLPTPVPSETAASPASDPSSQSSDAQQVPQNAAAPIQTASLTPSTTVTPVARKPDYGWLADSLLHRIEALKQYPAAARLNHEEGRVIVRIVIEEDGRITAMTITKSSGHDVLDHAALETLRQASPLALVRPLEKSPVTLHIPLNYRLGQ